MESENDPGVLAVAATGSGARAAGGRSTPFGGISHMTITPFHRTWNHSTVVVGHRVQVTIGSRETACLLSCRMKLKDIFRIYGPLQWQRTSKDEPFSGLER